MIGRFRTIASLPERDNASIVRSVTRSVVSGQSTNLNERGGFRRLHVMDGDETSLWCKAARDGFDRQAGCIRTVDRMIAVFVFQSLE